MSARRTVHAKKVAQECAILPLRRRSTRIEYVQSRGEEGINGKVIALNETLHQVGVPIGSYSLQVKFYIRVTTSQSHLERR